jgi:hypothetical protein
MVGVYAPTNGMTADSSLRRRAFQEQFLDYPDRHIHPGAVRGYALPKRSIPMTYGNSPALGRTSIRDAERAGRR